MVIKGLYPKTETIVCNAIRTIRVIESDSPRYACICLDKIIEAATELKRLIEQTKE